MENLCPQFTFHKYGEWKIPYQDRLMKLGLTTLKTTRLQSDLIETQKFQIAEPGVSKLLDGIKVNKASGPDNIPARVLKESADATTPILQCIFQKSIDTRTLPQDWCEANVSPIYKKDGRSDPANYRPVSLT